MKITLSKSQWESMGKMAEDLNKPVDKLSIAVKGLKEIAHYFPYVGLGQSANWKSGYNNLQSIARRALKDIEINQ